jgi:hypothetical protein
MRMNSRIRVRAWALLLPLLLLSALGARGQDFGTLSSAHFDVKFQNGVNSEEAKKVMEYLQKEYVSLAHELGLEMKNKLEVRLYQSPGKYIAETGLSRPWRGAFFTKGVLHVQPVAALVARKLFEKSISYELSVAFLEQTQRNGCPRWLVESFAAYYSGETSGMTAPIGARLSAFADLNQDIQEYPTPPQRDDVHYILASTMTFFVEKFGEKRAFRIYKEFDGATSVEKVFKKVFDDEYTSIEKNWAKYISSRTSSFK